MFLNTISIVFKLFSFTETVETKEQKTVKTETSPATATSQGNQ